MESSVYILNLVTGNTSGDISGNDGMLIYAAL